MNTFDIEKRFDYFLINKLWPKYDIEIISKYTNKEDQEKKGDYRVGLRNREFNIDNKAEYNTPQNFPIELIQDVPSQNLGWFYKLTQCNYIHYGVFDNGYSVKYVYSIDYLKLRFYDFSEGEPKYNNAPDRFGVTVFWIVPLKELVKRKIAKLLYD